MKKKCYIITGPNGAGKTTFATEFLPIEAECLNFINVDLIAQGLSPFQPDKMAVEAGRLVIKHINNVLIRVNPLLLRQQLGDSYEKQKTTSYSSG